MKTLDESTYASVPGRLTVCRRRYAAYFGENALDRWLYLVCTRLPWSTRNLAVVGPRVFRWVQTAEQFDSGCLNPAVVLDAAATGLVAVLTDLKALPSARPTNVVKILYERLDLIDSVPVKRGERGLPRRATTPEPRNAGCRAAGPTSIPSWSTVSWTTPWRAQRRPVASRLSTGNPWITPCGRSTDITSPAVPGGSPRRSRLKDLLVKTAILSGRDPGSRESRVESPGPSDGRRARSAGENPGETQTMKLSALASLFSALDSRFLQVCRAGSVCGSGKDRASRP